MKATIDGITVEGTVEEVLEFIAKYEPEVPKVTFELPDPEKIKKWEKEWDKYEGTEEQDVYYDNTTGRPPTRTDVWLSSKLVPHPRLKNI